MNKSEIKAVPHKMGKVRTSVCILPRILCIPGQTPQDSVPVAPFSRAILIRPLCSDFPRKEEKIVGGKLANYF